MSTHLFQQNHLQDVESDPVVRSDSPDLPLNQIRESNELWPLFEANRYQEMTDDRLEAFSIHLECNQNKIRELTNEVQKLKKLLSDQARAKSSPPPRPPPPTQSEPAKKTRPSLARRSLNAFLAFSQRTWRRSLRQFQRPLLNDAPVDDSDIRIDQPSPVQMEQSIQADDESEALQVKTLKKKRSSLGIRPSMSGLMKKCSTVRRRRGLMPGQSFAKAIRRLSLKSQSVEEATCSDKQQAGIDDIRDSVTSTRLRNGQSPLSNNKVARDGSLSPLYKAFDKIELSDSNSTGNNQPLPISSAVKNSLLLDLSNQTPVDQSTPTSNGDNIHRNPFHPETDDTSIPTRTSFRLRRRTTGMLVDSPKSPASPPLPPLMSFDDSAITLPPASESDYQMDCDTPPYPPPPSSASINCISNYPDTLATFYADLNEGVSKGLSKINQSRRKEDNNLSDTSTDKPQTIGDDTEAPMQQSDQNRRNLDIDSDLTNTLVAPRLIKFRRSITSAPPRGA